MNQIQFGDERIDYGSALPIFWLCEKKTEVIDGNQVYWAAVDTLIGWDRNLCRQTSNLQRKWDH